MCWDNLLHRAGRERALLLACASPPIFMLRDFVRNLLASLCLGGVRLNYSADTQDHSNVLCWRELCSRDLRVE